MLPVAPTNSIAARAWLLSEARSVAMLSHPNTTAAVYDFGRTLDGQPSIVMELIAGQTLGDRVRAGN